VIMEEVRFTEFLVLYGDCEIFLLLMCHSIGYFSGSIKLFIGSYYECLHMCHASCVSSSSKGIESEGNGVILK
jgi:hypothetical protein